MVWGLCGALSLRVTAPVRVPVAVGANFTLIVQLAPAATVLPQVPSPAKAKLPLISKLPLNVSVAFPVLVSVTNLTALVVPTAWLPKLSALGERLTPGAGVPDETPLPVRLTFWGLPVALSVRVTVPVSVPVVAGLKTTLNVQLAPAASVLMHVAPAPK